MIETKRRSLILNVVLTAIILVIGFLFWPGKEKFNQSNPRDVNKTQIKVKVKALNIRKEPTVDSKDIGTVYLGEIFTVLEHIDEEDYYWYKIKTKQGTSGYIASDRDNEYVEVISGMIDREAPLITAKNEVLVFLDDEKVYDDILCTDNYSECTLKFDDTDPNFVVVTGTDEAGNESVMQINSYFAYNLNTLFNDNNENIHLTITKKDIKNNTVISANYITNKDITVDNLSKSYTPVIDYFDENFDKIDNMYTLINRQSLGGMCINDENNSLKDEYLNGGIEQGDMLCINYSFNDKEGKIKYIAVGFVSTDNADNENNSLAKYYSKYFVIK